MRKWIISDTHFFHPNIIKYCERPANCDQIMIDHLIQIPREDILIHLGDVHFGNEQQLKSIISSMKCRKYLVRGNHDRWTTTKYMICGFDGVFDALVLDNVYMTHIPSEPPTGMINLHGHLHNLGYKGEPAFGEGFEQFRDEKHILYAPEIYNYVPLKLDWLISKGKRGDKYPPGKYPSRKRPEPLCH